MVERKHIKKSKEMIALEVKVMLNFAQKEGIWNRMAHRGFRALSMSNFLQIHYGC
jgi:hypothetical protein